MGANRRGEMKLLAVTVVLLFALARIQSVQAEKWTSEAVQVDLMHYLYEKSPSANPKLSLRDRFRIAVGNSLARAEYFNERISKSAGIKYSRKTFETPTYSNQGVYLMKVGLGSPVQNFVAIADTGSDVSWLQCDCQSCFSQPDPYFNPSASLSFSPEPCSHQPCTNCTTNGECAYFVEYGDLAYTYGILATDVITLGSFSATIEFGCGERNNGMTFYNTDGLVGLGRGPLSIITQLGITVFCYCLVSFYSAPSTTSPLIFGYTGGSFGYTPLVFNPIVPIFYYLNLQGLSLNGIQLDIPWGTFEIDSSGAGGIIIDSGTTVTMLQTAAYNPLLEKVKSLVTYEEVDGSSVGFDACYRPGVPNPSWPTLTFNFEGLNVVMPPDNFFLVVDTEGDYCMAITGNGGLSFGIFGNVQQQNFNIKYDLASSTVGFSPTTC